MMIRIHRERVSVVACITFSLFFTSLFYSIHKITRDTNCCFSNQNIFDDNEERYPLSRSAIKNSIHISSVLHMRFLEEYHKIDGWFSREILYVFWILSQYQYEHLNVFGGIGEIGVHHGKLTCYLYLLRRYQEQNLFAVDVFDNQALNKDGSGRGQKNLFLHHIHEYAAVKKNELSIYAGSSLDLNPVFSKDNKAIRWWLEQVVGERGLQIVSIDGGHTAILTYSDLCLVANSLADGGVVAVDDITHPGWLGVQDGTGRFLSETSRLINDRELEDEMAKLPNQTTIKLSQKIIEATNLRSEERKTSQCARLVPFLQFFNKLFLTTPKYYPYYIDLLGHQTYFANQQRSQGILYLEYHALRLTVGNVPIWTNNHDYNSTYMAEIFKHSIEPDWIRDIQMINQREIQAKLE